MEGEQQTGCGESEPGAHEDSSLRLADSAWRLLGPITWLMSQSPQHRDLFIGDVGWLVLPALHLKQCKLYVHKGMPIAYASWARVNDEVHARLKTGRLRLAPREWRSGGHAWLIDVVAPFGGAGRVLSDVRTAELAGEDVSMLAGDPAGRGVACRTWKADNSGPVNDGPGEKPPETGS